MQTFSRKIIECIKQVDGNITRFLALDGCEITLGREPNSGETKGKTKPRRKVHIRRTPRACLWEVSGKSPIIGLS